MTARDDDNGASLTPWDDFKVDPVFPFRACAFWCCVGGAVWCVILGAAGYAMGLWA